MKRTAFDEFRDQKTAMDVDTDRHLMCTAHGCPLRWSVNFSERLCTVHAGYERHDWPRVTEWIQHREAELAFQRQNRKPEPQRPAMSVEERKAIGQKLRRAFRQTGGKDWAHRLKAAEEAGKQLSPVQQTMWRQALGRGMAMHSDEVSA